MQYGNVEAFIEAVYGLTIGQSLLLIVMGAAINWFAEFCSQTTPPH